jgi:hypothetical protein
LSVLSATPVLLVLAVIKCHTCLERPHTKYISAVLNRAQWTVRSIDITELNTTSSGPFNCAFAIHAPCALMKTLHRPPARVFTLHMQRKITSLEGPGSAAQHRLTTRFFGVEPSSGTVTECRRHHVACPQDGDGCAPFSHTLGTRSLSASDDTLQE